MTRFRSLLTAAALVLGSALFAQPALASTAPPPDDGAACYGQITQLARASSTTITAVFTVSCPTSFLGAATTSGIIFRGNGSPYSQKTQTCSGHIYGCSVKVTFTKDIAGLQTYTYIFDPDAYITFGQTTSGSSTARCGDPTSAGLYCQKVTAQF